MSNTTSNKGDSVQGLSKLWKNGLFKSLLLVVLVVVGVFAFRELLIFGLRTEYPLETPISKSMEPTLKIGDLLIVQGGLNGSNIYANQVDGDIIVFRDPRTLDSLIVHRAIDKVYAGGKWYVITRGDNNPTRDRWYGFPGEGVPEEYVIGKVIGSIPYLGYVKIYLGTPVGMIVSIILLAVVLFLETLTSSKKSEKTEEKKEIVSGS